MLQGCARRLNAKSSLGQSRKSKFSRTCLAPVVVGLFVVIKNVTSCVCLFLQNLMAKALYDNVPESPEELAFRKGDILTVIEQNTGGLEGWWLCSLHGRQGIAPGNRLKLLIGPMFEAQSPSSATAVQSPPQSSAYQQKAGSAQGFYQVPPSHQSPQQQNQQSVYQVPPGQDVYQVPPRSTLAADNAQSKVVTPTRVGQNYSYSLGQHNQQDLYDVPPSRSQGVYNIPPGQMLGSPYPGQHGGAHSQGVYDVPSSQLDLRNQGVYDVPPSSQGVYSVPPCRTNPALQEGNYDFPQPLKHKQEGIYDVPPPALAKTTPSPQSHYDFPPSVEPAAHHQHTNGNEGIYDVPPPALHSGAGSQRDIYDVPRGLQASQHRTSPADRDRNKGVYDIPTQDSRAVADVTDSVNRLSFSSTGSTRSSMSTSSSSTGSSSDGRLALDVDTAIQRLHRLQQAVEVSVGALHSLAASPHWRTFPFMEHHANDVRTVLDRVRAALGDFIVFGRGAAANATALSDSSLHSKLRRQLGRLEDSQQILLQIFQVLENCSWALTALTASSTAKNQHKSDDLDRFVMVSRTVPDDTKQLASTVGSNAELLFRRTHMDGSFSTGSTPDENMTHTSPSSDNDNYQTKPFPVPSSQDKDNMNNSEKCVKSWMEDYDYVHLQGKEDFERQQKELLEKENIIKQNQVQLGQEQINQFKKLEQEVIKPVENDITQWISHQNSPRTSPTDSSSCLSPSTHVCARDRQLLTFYAEQCEQHFVTLLSAVDAFFSCVSGGQPPRIFVAHSKFVILSAHKLVFIGDTLSRQAAAPEVANRVMNSSNVLCDLLKTVVTATKTAALNYPNTAAIQEMVDRVTDLSHHSQQFKEQLLQMASV
ncbi:enhancer of filamentation 1 [Thalassophryne amazonica]|uniref:enhancer of filamentation 1 n=1 Tax=Thalassophryne amazonica TaxID=390379 RepID=UPI0014721EF9|nr:enhancer of filamentation 1 [Thalassophryne amazonica]